MKLYKNPIVRKKITNVRNHDNLPKVFKHNYNTQYLSNRNQKLTPHKAKKLYNSINNFKFCVSRQVSYNQLQVSKFVFNVLGKPEFTYLVNYLHIIYLCSYIQGWKINSYLDYQLVGLNRFLKSKDFNLNTDQLLPISHTNINGKVMCTSSSGLLTLSITSYKIILPSGSEYIGSTGLDTLVGKSYKTPTHKRNIQIQVRGIAKNPVDHPNGGRSNTKGSFKTPWGGVAKSNK